jgi:hypothetical protein
VQASIWCAVGGDVGDNDDDKAEARVPAARYTVVPILRRLSLGSVYSRASSRTSRGVWGGGASAVLSEVLQANVHKRIVKKEEKTNFHFPHIFAPTATNVINHLVLLHPRC